MTSYNGALHSIGFARETTPGTPEDTVDVFFSTMDINAKHNHEPIERKAFNASGRRLPSRPGWIKPDGKASFEIMASQPLPFLWILGEHTTAQPAVATDPTVYDHTITDSGEPVSLTVEADKVYEEVRQSGVRLDKLTLKAKAGDQATCEVDWKGLAHDQSPTITSVPAFPTDVLTGVAVTVKVDGAADVRINEIELVIDSGLDQYPVLEDADGAPRVVRRKETIKVSGKVKYADFPAEALSVIRNAETFALEIALLGDVISNAYRKSLTIDLPACQFTGGLDPDAADKLIDGDADFEAFYDVVTGRQIRVIARNTVAVIS